MSDNRNTISNENWVELYATLSNYILEYSSLDPIWIIDEDGNEVRTEEKQNEFIGIVDQVEAIMEAVLTKESSNKIDQGDVADMLGSFNEFDEIDYRIKDCATKGCVAVVYFYEDKLSEIDQITAYNPEEGIEQALAERRENNRRGGV